MGTLVGGDVVNCTIAAVQINAFNNTAGKASPRLPVAWVAACIALWYQVVCEGQSGAVPAPLFASAPPVARPQAYITTASVAQPASIFYD